MTTPVLSDVLEDAVKPAVLRPQTNKQWDCFDILNRTHPRPPRGRIVYCVNPGGVGSLSPWYVGVRYWAYYPGIPDAPAPEDLLPVAALRDPYLTN